MNNYDLKILSPVEFEDLSRDLIQLEFNIRLESFSEGKDFGIDFRCLNSDLIVQCKRTKSKANLLSSLKCEVDKIVKLQPKRYLITTSLPLSVQNKNQIRDIFTDLKQTEVIVLGNEDLNNLIGQYKEVELKYYKLWLSSTNILQRILHSKLHNLNNFGLEEIRNKLSIYVQNKSLDDALEILKKNNYVIISGIPGIGKTTLAEIVSYTLLANGYEELIYINDNIDVGFEAYCEEKSQVFFYDDFLGRNFLLNSLNKNEDGKLLAFIKLINRSSNKKLIFTTREYILNQAKINYEFIDKLKLSKYILDLARYSIIDKAKILYNHFYFSKLPYEFIESLLVNRKIFTVIKHRNYSPRIIETLTISKSWTKKATSTYADYIISLLDHPYEIWLHAFEQQISDVSRFILKNLLLNQKIKYFSLYTMVKRNFKRERDTNLTSLDYQNSMKELGNCFVKISEIKDELEVDFYNPSIHDFLVHYINSDKELLYELFDNIYYINKINQIFSFQKIIGKIYIDNEAEHIFYDKLIKRINDLEIYSGSEDLNEFTPSEIQLIRLINMDKLMKNPSKEYFSIAKEILNISVSQESIHSRLTESYFQLFIKYMNMLNLNKDMFVMQLSNDIELIKDLEIIDQLLLYFPSEFEKYIEPQIEQLLRPIISDLYLSIDHNNYYSNDKNYEIKNKLEEIKENYKINVEFELSAVEERITAVIAENKRIAEEEYGRFIYDSGPKYQTNEEPQNFTQTENVNKVQTIEINQSTEELLILEMFKKLKNE